MNTTASVIDHATLVKLLAAGAVECTEVVGQGAGWGLVVRYGKAAHPLAARRGALRTFRKFETLVAYLKDLGISRYEVNAEGYDPQATTGGRSRPDAALRMREAFDAKAHADWVREKTTASLADPRPNEAHARVMAEAQAVIDAKRESHARRKTAS